MIDIPRKIVVDMDGTLCTQEDDYANAEPIQCMIAVVNYLHNLGTTVVVYTARGTETGIDWRTVTERQLADWGVNYDELLFGKPSCDLWIDDRAVIPEEFCCKYGR